MSEINFLRDYCDLDAFAVDVHKHPRTVARWINQPDGLHPNERGVAVLVDRIAPVVARLLGSAS